MAAESGGGPLIPDQRRELLLRHLRADNVLSIRQLVELLGVSHMTVRRDVFALEQSGRVHSVPGGVRLARQLREEPAREDKSTADPAAKRAMAAQAAERLHDGMTVYLDAGTTLAQLVPHLAGRSGITVVTNDFAVVELLLDEPEVEVIHAGGRVDKVNRSSVGHLAEAVLERVAVDVAFISGSSWDLKHGLTTPYAEKVGVKRTAMGAATESVLVAGSSKYGRFGTYRVCPLGELSSIITDSALDEEAREALREAGIRVELAS